MTGKPEQDAREKMPIEAFAEAAAESSAQEPLWTRTFVILTGLNFGIALPFYLLMVVMADHSMAEYGVSYGVGALTVSAFVLAALVARFFAGNRIDKWGAVKSLWIGLAINLVTTVTYLFPMPFELLVLMRTLQGVGFAISSGSVASAAAMTVPSSRRGEGIGYFSMMQALATGVGPFIAVMLNNITGSYFPLFAFTAAITALSLLFMPFVKLPARIEQPGQANPSESKPKGLSRFVHTTVLLLTPSLFLIYLGYSGIVTFVVPYANEAELGGAVSFYFVLYAAVILLTRPPVGRHVDKHGEHPLIYLAIASLIVGLVMLGLAGNEAMLLGSSVLAGFGIGATQSILQAVIARDVPAEELGRANSTFFMSMDLGAGLGPMLIGALVPLAGFSLCYILLAVAAVLACVIYHFLGRRGRAQMDSSANVGGSEAAQMDPKTDEG